VGDSDDAALTAVARRASWARPWPRARI
jgi:hypothetical protein